MSFDRSETAGRGRGPLQREVRRRPASPLVAFLFSEPFDRPVQSSPERFRVVRSKGEVSKDASGLVQDDVLVQIGPVELDPQLPAPKLQPHALRVGVRDLGPFHFVERDRDRLEESIQLDSVVEDAIFLPEVLGRAFRSVQRISFHMITIIITPLGKSITWQKNFLTR
jgi:hypothetical protein